MQIALGVAQASTLGALVAPLLALQYIGGFILRLAVHMPFIALAAAVALLPTGAVLVGLGLCINFVLGNPVLGGWGGQTGGLRVKGCLAQARVLLRGCKGGYTGR
jgi:hypothetical protein